MVKALRTTRKAKRAPVVAKGQGAAQLEAAQLEKRTLQRRLQVERDIVRLAGQLERRIRTTDGRLLDLGTALIERAARTLQGDAAHDADIAAAREGRDAVERG